MKTILTLPFLIFIGFMPVTGDAQYVTISGYVTNLLTGTSIENVAVFDKSSGIGTISNKDGFYKLILKPGQMNITFSDDGFDSYTQNFFISADTTLLIKLKPSNLAKKNDKFNVHLQTESENEKITERKKF